VRAGLAAKHPRATMRGTRPREQVQSA
jgi:hypothetical protein